MKLVFSLLTKLWATYALIDPDCAPDLVSRQLEGVRIIFGPSPDPKILDQALSVAGKLGRLLQEYGLVKQIAA